MTLRERIAELENDLAEGRYGSTMHDAGSAREFVCENLKRHLDETANADAEILRLARIGELVEMQAAANGGYLEIVVQDQLGRILLNGCDEDGHNIPAYGNALLDALESLKAKTEGK